jgi:hypothetical protein
LNRVAPRRGKGKISRGPNFCSGYALQVLQVLHRTAFILEVNMVKRPDNTAAPKPVEIVLDEAEPGTLRTIAGSKSDRFNGALIRAMVQTGWFPAGQSEEDRNQQLFVSVTGLRAFAPADEIEGMLGAMAMASYHTSLECSRKAMIPDQPFEVAQGLRKAAASASRAFTELLAALDRRRGKNGQQTVRVEHVHIHPGGRAVVGNITTGGGGAHEMREEPHGAPTKLAHDTALGADLPTLRSADAGKDAMPVARDEGSPSLPPTRRPQHGTADSRRPGANTCCPDNARSAHG